MELKKSSAGISVVVVAAVHLLIMFVEMFPMDHPMLLAKLEDQLGFADGQGRHAAPIVFNAVLFNGFLVAGLIWGLFSKRAPFEIRTFFLGCIWTAGLVGALTLPNEPLPFSVPI